MKRIFFLLLSCSLFSLHLFAQSDKVYTIVTCPAEETSTSMNVSWAADTSNFQSYLLYTLKSDKKWKKAIKIEPDKALCSVFDSVYSKNAAGENFYEDALFIKCNASLLNLKPDTDYMYRIFSEDDSASDIHYFKTSGAKNWSACIISDIHCYTPLPKRLIAAEGMMEKIQEYDNSIDWVLHLGDVCAWGGSYSFWKELYNSPWVKNYMWAGVNGNHDNMTRKYRLTNEFFKNANFYPRNGYHGEEGVCYFFKYSDVLFIMLNNENMRKDEELERAQKWVREVITNNPARFTIVCEHYQWFFGERGKSSHYERWCELFDELGVDLALAGNNHIYIRTNALYQGKESDGSVGTVYVQAPSSDNERGVSCDSPIEENRDKIKFRWTEGGQTVGGMHLKVTTDEMTVSLLNREGVVIDSVKVISF